MGFSSTMLYLNAARFKEQKQTYKKKRITSTNSHKTDAATFGATLHAANKHADWGVTKVKRHRKRTVCFRISRCSDMLQKSSYYDDCACRASSQPPIFALIFIVLHWLMPWKITSYWNKKIQSVNLKSKHFLVSLAIQVGSLNSNAMCKVNTFFFK